MIGLIILVFGFLFAYRTMVAISQQQKFPDAFLKLFFKLLICFNIVLACSLYFAPKSLLMMAVFFELLALQNLEQLFNVYLRYHFDTELIKFVDEVILTMSTGRSFRDALQAVYKQQPTYFTKKIVEIHQSVSLNSDYIKIWKDEPKFLALWHLFSSLELNSFKQLEKMRAFRRQLYWEQNFRRKSAQATSQVKAQAFVLSILYLALLVYVINTTGAQTYKLIFISLIFYLTGLLSLFILGKRKPWNT